MLQRQRLSHIRQDIKRLILPQKTQNLQIIKQQYTLRQENKFSFLEKEISNDSQSQATDDQNQNYIKSFNDFYRIDALIGQGSHAVVKKCFKIHNSIQQIKDEEHIFSVKIFRTSDPEIINTIKKTFHNQLRLRHQNICQVYELFINEKLAQIHLVQEYIPYHSLEYFIKKKKKFSTNQIKIIFKNILLAVEYLHRKGICHRDLKPDNILVNVDNLDQIKIIDFGVSKKFIKRKGRMNDMWTRTGSLFYQAPEMFDGVGYDEKIDIWALGVILYQLCFQKLPFQSDTIMETIDLIQKCEYPKINSDQLSFDLISRIFKLNPQKRLNIQEILTHPWLSINKNNQQFQDDIVINQNDNMYLLDVSQSSSLFQQDLTQEFQKDYQMFGNTKNTQSQWINIHHIQNRQRAKTDQIN